MRVATVAGLVVCLLAALLVCLLVGRPLLAQIPADPLAGSVPGGNPATQAGDAKLPAPFVTRQGDVEIPFSVKPGATGEAQPTAVRIFVSWDRGQSWHFYDERKPEEGRFRFRPRQDGEFWFATQTIDRAGRPDSPEPKQPQLRLVVDTQRPQLLVQAHLDASGNVNVAWSASDASLAPASLKVEYQDAGGSGGVWQTVQLSATPAAAPGQLSGQATFRPQVASRAINLRAEIADAAGNVAYHSQRLSLHPPPRQTAGGGNSGPANDPSATRWTTDNPHTNAPSPAASPPSEQVRIPNLVDNPFTGSGRLASSVQRPAVESLPPPVSPQPSPAVNSLPPPVEERAAPPAAGPKWSAAAQPAPRYEPEPAPPPTYDSLPLDPAMNAPAESAAPIPPAGGIYGGDPPPPPDSRSPTPDSRSPTPDPQFPAPESLPAPEVMPTPEVMPPPEHAPTEPLGAPPGQRPRLTNTRRFSLDYDVESVGPEGVSAVELWGTTDGGQTWTKWGADPDRASPFDVEVNSEATYGFRIVIVGRNGLATSTPQPGDAADIWVSIDLSRPTARLTGAAYGEGPAAGRLDIRWEAADANLGSRPVTLAIGDRPDGPFTPIAAGLPNSGQYLWEYDPRSPRQIFLRLEVRDEAGNTAIDQLTEPIKVEGLEPKGRIRGFNPASKAARGAFRSPLFR